MKWLFSMLQVIHQVDKKFLACLISTRDEEAATLNGTEGIGATFIVLSCAALIRVSLYLYCNSRKPACAGGSTCCTRESSPRKSNCRLKRKAVHKIHS